MNNTPLSVPSDTAEDAQPAHQHATPSKRYSLAELLAGMEIGDSLPIDLAFENMPPVGQEVL